MLLTFFLPMLPIAQPRQRHTRSGHNYTPADHPVQAFKYALGQQAREQLQRQQCPLPAFDGPVSLTYTLYFPRPKALQWKRRPQVRGWHAHTPDLENVQKALQDALTGIAWRDDAQIAQVSGRKVICSSEDTVGVFLCIQELKETP